MNILIVDDNPINLKFLYYSLRDEYDVDLANDGHEGLQMTKSKKFDLIIMDLWMPRLDGAEVTNQIRSLDSNLNQSTPIIFFTTSNAEDDKKRCLSMGANDYLVKPINTMRLKEKLEYFLS